MRVLVVDDSADVRLLCRLTLERAGWTVVCAADGQEGLDAVERTDPDAVVLDLMMPQYDGLYFLDHLQERPHGFRRVPVLVLSALSEHDVKARALAAGASAYLTKPFELDQLIRLVAMLASPSPQFEAG